MRSIPALALGLAFGTCLAAETSPCYDPSLPWCQPLDVRGTVVGKTVLDPLTLADQLLSAHFSTPGGSSGWIDSVELQGFAMYRLSVDAQSQLPLAGFTLKLAEKSAPLAWLDNATGGGRASDWVLLNLPQATDVTFVYANGLQPGESSRWIVDLSGGAGFAALGLGSVADMLGGASAAQPLLAAAVPEPAGLLMLAAGLLALRLRQRRGAG